MPSRIEIELLRPRELNGLTGLEIYQNKIVLGLSRWDALDEVTKFHFSKAKIISIEQMYHLEGRPTCSCLKVSLHSALFT